MTEITLIDATTPIPRAKQTYSPWRTSPKEPGQRPSLAHAEKMGQIREWMRLYDIEGYEKAVPELKKILEETPTYTPAHVAIAETLSLWGFRRELNGRICDSFYDQAVRHADTAVRLSPERSASHRAMAVALRRGRFQNVGKRKEEILTALDLDPSCADNWYEYWRAFGYDLSDPAIKRALELDPALCGAHIDFGVVLCEAGRLEEACRHLESALHLNPRNSLALYDVAMVYDRLGRNKKAREIIRAAQVMHPANVLISSGSELLNR